jgi:PAS domain S-box-containing protein
MDSRRGPGLSPAYDTLHIGIALYDPTDGSVADANDRAVSILGYDRATLRSLDVDRYTANTYSFSASDFRKRLRAASAGEAQTFTWRVKRGDGELVWVRLRLSQRAADDKWVRAEIRDITNHYDAKHRAGLFWRILRHDIRNKSAIVSGYAEEIADGDDPDQMRAAAAIISDAATDLGNAATSVRQIQEAVTADPGDRRVRSATQAVEDVAAECRTDYPDAEITVTEREAVGIAADRAFSHALRHAIENAIVHSDAAAPTVEVRIGRSPNTGRAELSIVDENPPIDDAELDVLFRPDARTSTRHGSGVGLFVMRWCVESLGGEIGIERHARGNVVRFYFPPKPVSGDDPAGTADAP